MNKDGEVRDPIVNPEMYCMNMYFDKGVGMVFYKMCGEQRMYAEAVLFKIHFFVPKAYVMIVGMNWCRRGAKLSCYHCKVRKAGGNYLTAGGKRRCRFPDYKARVLLYKREEYATDTGQISVKALEFTEGYDSVPESNGYNVYDCLWYQ